MALMSEESPFQEELKFPTVGHFRIIAENQPGMFFVIETVLQQMGISAPLKKEHLSKQGHYQSFSVTTLVESREMMNKIDAALRAIVGVKMVL